jgi:O-antigen ligase
VAVGPIKLAQALVEGVEGKGSPNPKLWVALAMLLGVVLAVVLSSPSTWLVAAGLVGGTILLVASWSITRRPMWLFPTLVAIDVVASLPFLPLESDSHWELRYPLLVVFCVPFLPRLVRSDFLWRGGYRLYWLYFAWAIVWVPLSLSPMTSAGRLASSMLAFGALLVVPLAINSEHEVVAIFDNYFILVAILAVSVASSIFFLGRDQLTVTGENPAAMARFSGMFSTPNLIGQIMMLTVGPILAFWRHFSKHVKVLLAVVMLTSVVMAAAADSRTAFIAMACGVAAYLVWRYRARGLLGVIALTLLVAGLAVVVPQYFFREITTLTGRTEEWQFAFKRLLERPLTGFGYAVEGQILQDRYFPVWSDFFDAGAQVQLQSGYLSRAVGLGIPALGLWLFLILRPWFWVMRRKDDPWGLKPIALLVVVPLMVRWFSESEIGDCRDTAGIMLVMTWAIAERLRLLTLDRAPAAARAQALSPSPLGVAIANGSSLPGL